MRILGIHGTKSSFHKSNPKASQTSFMKNGRITYTFNGPYDVAYRKALEAEIKKWSDCEKIFKDLRDVALQHANKIKNEYVDVLKLPLIQILGLVKNCNRYEEIPIIQEPDQELPLVLIKDNDLVFNRTNRRKHIDDSFCFSLTDNRKDLHFAMPELSHHKHYVFWPDTLNIKTTYITQDLYDNSYRIFDLKYYKKDGTENFWKNFMIGN
jgi:hypothetical protein